MDISIIVPTYNRSLSVQRVVSLLAGEVQAHQLGDRVEIIVVDDASPDEVSGAIQAFLQSGLSSPIRYIRMPRRSGPSGARNAGVECSRGRVLAFIDDDVLPADDYIRAVIAVHGAHPEALVICGNLRPLRDDIYSRFWFYQYAAVFNPQAEFCTVPRLASGNCAIKRELLEIERPLFDESLPTREDHDLYLRLRQRGIPVYKSNRMLAFNDCRATLRGFLRQRLGYARGQERLVAKHGTALLSEDEALSRIPRAARFLHLYLALAVAGCGSRTWRRLRAMLPSGARR